MGVRVGASPSTSLVAAVVDLARSLDVHLVAEGVEHDEQARSLLTLGCHEAQGYHFHRPMPAEAVGRLLAVSHEHGSHRLSLRAWFALQLRWRMAAFRHTLAIFLSGR